MGQTKKEKRIFINSIIQIIDKVEKDANMTVKRKLETVAFATLSILDGETFGIGPYSVKAIDENGKKGKDIAGNLHQMFVNYRSKK